MSFPSSSPSRWCRNNSTSRTSVAIRATTLEKFGPVRSVRPTLVFEIGFKSIGASTGHKSGIAVRFPRMLRIRRDKPLHEADSIAALRALVDGG
jgi:DNA ligase-1